MDKIRGVLLHCFPAEIDDRFEAQGLVILLPTISDQDRIRIQERIELELCSSVRIIRRVNMVKDEEDGDRCGTD
jgi:hypothetical protein